MSKKCVVIGVCGGIACYKICQVVSTLVKNNIEVHVIMTKHACEFVSPLTFETLSRNEVFVDMFDQRWEGGVAHIELAKKADLFFVAPATANIIGKMAQGIYDDMLMSTLCACTAPILVAPAMNTNMYLNPAVQANMTTLKQRGNFFIEPISGMLACMDEGIGKLPDPEDLVAFIQRHLERNEDMEGLKVLITAGPTREAIDPVRYITNHSTGKMGYALAEECVKRGASVTLISGATALQAPGGIDQLILVTSAEDMYQAVIRELGGQDIIIKTAAVADYKPEHTEPEKMKKGHDTLTLTFCRTKDIAQEIGKQIDASQTVFIGFAAETNDVTENAAIKVAKKGFDFIVSNDVTKPGAGFGWDTNIVTMIDREGTIEELPLMSKKEVAQHIADKALDIYFEKKKKCKGN